MQYFTKKHPETRRFVDKENFVRSKTTNLGRSVDSSPEGLYIALTRRASEYLMENNRH